jgi:murein DD-endopeptidase MepM/ murein hydrolase activator NlpD
MTTPWKRLGIFFLMWVPLAVYGEILYYRLREPFFKLPLGTEMQIPALRNDAYGEGHFGASRNGGRVHEGLDWEARIGDSVWASKSGRVSFAGTKGGYGTFVEIKHPDGLRSRYAHLDSVYVKAGDWVKRGQLVGEAGKTGNASSPFIKAHLHFEIRDKHKALDPNKLLGAGLSAKD